MQHNTLHSHSPYIWTELGDQMERNMINQKNVTFGSGGVAVIYIGWNWSAFYFPHHTESFVVDIFSPGWSVWLQ